MRSLYKYVINKVDISRKRERLIYWILIAALCRISILSVSMTKVEDLDDGLRYTDESNGIVNDFSKHQEDEIDKSCHLPTDSDYYEYDKSEEYGYDKNNEDNIDEGTGERIFMGPCNYLYPNNIKPKGGYLNDIDFYYLRDKVGKVETCFLKCIDVVEQNKVKSWWLVQSSALGLPNVSHKLMTKFGFDPVSRTKQLNAVQLAIRGGHAHTVKVLTNSNSDMVIDSYGRTVADYVRMKGSPIRPIDAKLILGVIVQHNGNETINMEKGSYHEATADKKYVTEDENNSGWNTETSYSYDETCDLDVIDRDMLRSVFFKDYFSTGRPFVLRGHVPKEEVAAFSKDRWNTKRHYNTHTRQWNVGPTAYPDKTDQSYCRKRYTIAEIENCTKCAEMPDIPMVTAWHPTDEDFDILYPMYSEGDFYKYSGWRTITDWFGPVEEWEQGLSWQVFMGGDESGATLHWHLAALNMLYVGIKGWRLTAPSYRGWTGMPARKAAKMLDESYKDITLRCTQHAGDLIYVPEHWGHLTLNHGFTIGAAVILPADYHSYKHNPRDSTSIATTSSAVSVYQQRKIPFMFVHINKTGGSSIIEMFRSRCSNEYHEEAWGVNHRTFHATALTHIDHFGRTVWDDAYTFAIVRHPLARQISNFFFLAKFCEDKPMYCKIRQIPETVIGENMDMLTDEQKVKAFHRWIWDLYESYPPDHPDHYLLGSSGHGNEEVMSFNNTQTSWLVDENDKIAVKDIFRLEDLSKDMRKLSKMIPCLNNNNEDKQYYDKSTSSRKLRRGNTFTGMISRNISPEYPDYELFTKNQVTTRIIKDIYAADFKNFGYTL